MAANIQSMMYTGEVPWHGLGTKVEGEQTAESAIQAAGLDWTVQKSKMFYQGKDGQPKQVPDQFAVVRMDSGKCLGTVGNVYRFLQNREAFRFADSIIQEKAAVYHTAGALGGGEKVWMLAKLDGVCRVKGQDVVDKYLLLSNSHDGSSNVRICLTPVRVVCQNTLTQAIQSAESLFHIRHTASMGGKVDAVRNALGLTNKWFADFEAKAAALAGKVITTATWEVYMESLGFKPDAEAGREKANADTLTRLFESGRGQSMPEIKGTAWAAYNAVTEYLTHERSTRVTNGFQSEQEARLNSLWFGSSQRVNQDAWDKALALLK